MKDWRPGGVRGDLGMQRGFSERHSVQVGTFLGLCVEDGPWQNISRWSPYGLNLRILVHLWFIESANVFKPWSGVGSELLELLIHGGFPVIAQLGLEPSETSFYWRW